MRPRQATAVLAVLAAAAALPLAACGSGTPSGTTGATSLPGGNGSSTSSTGRPGATSSTGSSGGVAPGSTLPSERSTTTTTATGATTPTTGGSVTGGLKGKSAAEIIALATQAAAAKGSVRYSSRSVTTIGNSVVTADIAAGTGSQSLSEGGLEATIRLVGTEAYIDANAAFLETSFRFTPTVAARYADRWLSVKRSDPEYQAVATDLTLSSELSDSTPAGRVVVIGSRAINGAEVVGVSGGLPASTGASPKVSGSLQLYVSAAAPYLPVEATISITFQGRTDTSTEFYSRWGEAVTVEVPSGAVPISVAYAG